jgi:hypothetical protein
MNFPFPIDWYFFIGLSLGALIVTLVSLQKFHERASAPRGNELLEKLTPKYLTTREEYMRAFLLYYLAPMLFVLFVIALIGPGVLKLGDVNLPQKDWPAGVWPIFAALMFGGATSVPWLKELEIRVRRFAHERAYIPERARATADRLRAAEFDFPPFQAVLNSAAMRGVVAGDFSSPRDSIEYAWARLSCVSYEIGRRRESGGPDDLDDEMLDRYGEQLHQIAGHCRTLEKRVAEYRKSGADHAAETDDLRESINGSLRDLYVFLACAVLKKYGRDADMKSVFQPFGFVLKPMPIASTNFDIIVVGLAVMTLSVFLLLFAAYEIGHWFGGNVWQPSQDFPRKVYEPFIWSLTAALIHGTAILLADRLRGRMIGRGRWFGVVNDVRRAIPANYIKIAVMCAIPGYIVTMICGAFFQGISLELLQGAAPYALLPATTAAFYGYHMDNVELNTRPTRRFEIVTQAFATGFCSVVAAPVWLAVGRGTGDVLDFIALSGVIGTMIGATLAWYIPKGAEQRLTTPVVIAKRDRIAAIRAAAHERFGDDELATQWLTKPSQDLGNCAPIEAAADIENYDNVIGLLERPNQARAA